MAEFQAVVSSIRASFVDALAFCNDWIDKQPSPSELPIVFRNPLLVEAAGAVFPEHFSALYDLPADASDYMKPNRFSVYLSMRRALVSHGISDEVVAYELQRQCSLIAIDKASVSNDQMAESETGGYIDTFDLPPWDTWVWLEDGQLVAWVPSWITARVDQAIACESHGAYSWVRVIGDGQLQIVGWGQSFYEH